MMKRILASLALAAALPAMAGTYTQTPFNYDKFDRAIDLTPYFSVEFSPIINDRTGENTSLVSPWVTVNGSNASTDFYSFRTTKVGTIVLDMDDAPFSYDSYLTVYNEARQVIYNNDDYYFPFYGPDQGSNSGLDSFIQLDDAAIGKYYVEVARCCKADHPGAFRLNVQIPSAVPEAGSVALVVGGLSVTGLAIRRRVRAA